MAFIRNSLSALVFALAALRPALAQDDSVCVGELNKDLWLQQQMNLAILDFGSDLLDEIQQSGYQFTLSRAVGGTTEESYFCGVNGGCDVTLLAADCLLNPVPATILKAAANWVVYWFGVMTNFDATMIELLTQVPDIELSFNPPLEFQTPGVAVVDQSEMGDIIRQTLMNMITAYPPVAAARAANVNNPNPPTTFAPFSQRLNGTVTGVAQDNPGLTGGYNQYADIGLSLQALRAGITEGIRIFIETEVNVSDEDMFLPPEVDANIIFSLRDGDFAAPVATPDAAQLITASVIGPAINRIWNERQVVVIKITSTDSAGAPIFPSGIDPCVGDNVFLEGIKFCDDEGNAFLLRQIPGDLAALQAANPENIFQAKPFDVPNIVNLPNFGLSLSDVILSAVNTQAANSFFGEPVVSDDPLRISPENVVHINVPVCNFNEILIQDAQKEQCNRPGVNVELCISNLYLFCGCPQMNVPPRAWPYETLEAPQCAGFPPTL